MGDRYRILQVLKTRAQTATYLCSDTRSGGSKVVLRELPVPDLGPSSNDLQVLFAWFEEERKLLQRVQHPSMARLRDFHFLDGWLYIVTEYVEGQTLEVELSEYGQPLPAEELVYQVLDVLELLDNLHSLNPPMLHRDIKPANLVREAGTGTIRLVGIGLARPGETATAQAAGGYSPLEQIHGHAEPRSDLYALGATLSQLLTGEPPIPLGIPPVLDLNPNADPELAALVDRACAFTPEKRFQTAREMGEALNGWLERRGTFLPTNLTSELVSTHPGEELAPWGKLPPLGPMPEPEPAPEPVPAPAAAVKAYEPRRFEPAAPTQWKPRPRPPVFPKQATAIRHQVVPPRPTGGSPGRIPGSWQALEHQSGRDPGKPPEPGFKGEFAWLAEPEKPKAAVAPPAPAVEADEEEEWTGGVPSTEDEVPSKPWTPPTSKSSGHPSGGTKNPLPKTAAAPPPPPRPPVPATRPPAPAPATPAKAPEAPRPKPASGRSGAHPAYEERARGISPVLAWILFLIALAAVVGGGYFAGRYFHPSALQRPAPTAPP